MLQRAHALRDVRILYIHYSTYNVLISRFLQHVNKFTRRIADQEDDVQRCAKLRELRVSADEWEELETLLAILLVRTSSPTLPIIHSILTKVFLQVSDTAQQSFSSDTQPALHRALPALEMLHASWTKCLDMPEFDRFTTALEAGLNTIEQYYNKTSVSDIYTMSMREYICPFVICILFLTLHSYSA